MCNWVRGHTPFSMLPRMGSSTGFSSRASHVTFPMVFTTDIHMVQCSPSLYIFLKWCMYMPWILVVPYCTELLRDSLHCSYIISTLYAISFPWSASDQVWHSPILLVHVHVLGNHHHIPTSDSMYVYSRGRGMSRYLGLWGRGLLVIALHMKYTYKILPPMRMHKLAHGQVYL